MVDTLTPAERSERMRRIRSSNTKPEVLLRSALHARGLRFRLHRRQLPGKPDVVLPRHRVAVFVHGCFWHRHEGCKVATTPKSNTQFWVDKFDRNVARDKRVRSELEAAGWRVIVSWECEVDTPAKAAATAERLETIIREEPRDLSRNA
ncbi:very short patch repair endonuclease [Enterovirga sp. GCM10030262]|uniref:very short patch repair endonuclease n=1 Tax=Enterovirga sp. GCM10030262 TaxID=3273391 RepID=UPI00360E6568